MPYGASVGILWCHIYYSCNISLGFRISTEHYRPLDQRELAAYQKATSSLVTVESIFDLLARSGLKE